MAFSKNGNVIYLDTTGTETGKYQLLSIIATSTAANAVLELKDGNDAKIEVRVPTANDTKTIDLSQAPIRFNTSLNVTTATTVHATLVIRKLGD